MVPTIKVAELLNPFMVSTGGMTVTDSPVALGEMLAVSVTLKGVPPNMIGLIWIWALPLVPAEIVGELVKMKIVKSGGLARTVNETLA